MTEADLFVEPLFTEVRTEILELLEADDRLVVPSKYHDEVTNFWTDSKNRRGLFRRTTWASFKSQNPEWETILDIDALAEAEGQSWVIKGLDRRPSDRRRMLVDLSPGFATDEATLNSWSWTADHLLVGISEHVRTRRPSAPFLKLTS